LKKGEQSEVTIEGNRISDEMRPSEPPSNDINFFAGITP
jgi:hypothetical protein